MSYIFYKKKLTVKNCTNNWGGNINQSFHMTLLRNTQVPIKHLLLILHKPDTANCFSFFFLEMHCCSCGMWKKNLSMYQKCFPAISVSVGKPFVLTQWTFSSWHDKAMLMLHCKCLQGITGLCRVSLLWGNPAIFTDCREIL